MFKTVRLVLVVAAVMLLAISCQRDLGPTSPMSTRGLTSAPAVVSSATLWVYVNTPSGQTVEAHRITSGWGEYTVTWFNFGSAYAPGVEGSFVSDAVGWHSIDITALMQSWVDSTYPNYGVVLKQVNATFPRNKMNSREAADFHPYIQVCFNGNCQTLDDLADAWIYQIESTFNGGHDDTLFTGWNSATSFEKISLLRFAMPSIPSGGCTRTIGYWKTHAGFGPQADVVTPLLPIWLGTMGGLKSIDVTTAQIAVDILSQNVYGKQSNGITKLYGQLLGAKLNFASGADNSVASVVTAADAFLATHNYLDWSSLSKADKAMVLGWQSALDDYNNGFTGPEHCEDDVPIS